MAKSTIRDISRVTGLSIFTVSRALSEADGVSEASRERIFQAASDLGYVRNRAAQELRRASRDSVAVITASTSNSYYLDLMAGIQQALEPSAWTVVVGDVAVNGAYDPNLEDRMIRRLLESRTAGVISTLTLRPENTRLLAQWDIPVVFVDSSAPDGEFLFPSVTTDNFNASLMVGQHLADHGYEDWLFLVYPARWSTRLERERGIREAALIHGVSLVVLESGNDAGSAYKTLAAHLDASPRPPRALIAGNNPLLLGSMQLLSDRRISIPSDVAVVAFDEFAWSALTNPPMTVLNEHSEEIGRRAAATLKRVIEKLTEAERSGKSASPVYLAEDRQQVPAKLIVRSSCGCSAAPNPFATEAA
ncbi:LacI family DNA-binding transcriptional regulator [Mesorhizobium sp.]|uniref:LacI family DNA-binding transcriptional regulator n=1 Tax=Mesorhizobium sp. TaxID=1871066 RepID=UPI00121227D7|nr:LacI family DNA-binding transcriptional regulator [Mesorhizobium sp.]TIP09176.1 MAG: LacI family transcriptional regulator [Mesorhizobium sp.]